jgi:hypothetical protein
MPVSGKEVIFINLSTTDCKAFHEVIQDNDSMNGPVKVYNSVSSALAYLKLGGDFLLIITPDDFPSIMEPLKNYIMRVLHNPNNYFIPFAEPIFMEPNSLKPYFY